MREYRLYIRRLVFLGFMSLTFSGAKADDYEVLFQRLYTEYVETSPYADTVIRGFMDTLHEDGSWPDIDYGRRTSIGGWRAMRHWGRLFHMALAYNRSDNSLFKHPHLKEKIKKATTYWYNRDPQPYSNNWYDNDIALPEYIYKVLILMKNEYEGRDWETVIKRGCEGYLILPTNYYRVGYKNTHINACWIARGLVHHGIILRDSLILQRGIDIMAAQVTVQSVDKVGLQPDQSYLVHGRQLYNAGYGKALLSTISYYMHLTWDISFAGFRNDDIKMIGDMLLYGDQWMVYGRMYDFSTAGRYIARKGERGISSTQLGDVLKRMELVDTARRFAYRKMLTHINTPKASSVGILGNKYFWRADYMSHRRQHVFFGVKLCSERTVGTEAMNGENVKGFWLPFGATTIMRNTKEYYDIFGLWDWTKIPGVTNPAIEINWPERRMSYASNQEVFVGGASDGNNGVAALCLLVDTVISKRTVNVSGKKAYFLFGSELICLGTEISSKMKNVPITTTLNQSFLRGTVMVDGISIPKQDRNVYRGVKWVHHDNTGYVFRNPTTIDMKNDTQMGNWHDINRGLEDTTMGREIFKLWLTHGYTPTASTYEYVVLPNLTSEQTNLYATELPFVTLLNSSEIQAIRHDSLNYCGAVFYEASSVDVGEFSITVDKPCILLIDFNDSLLRITAADPNQSQTKIEVTLSYGSDVTESLCFSMPKGIDAGKSMTLQAKTRWRS